MIERITDKHIQVQALQHLLIHYENKRDRYLDDGREDIVETLNSYIAKIRRTIVKVLQESENIQQSAIKFY
tara:strand:- start:1032 stop:1244 length:213 start_codon:yes stop_codon:yes gene_type:complete